MHTAEPWQRLGPPAHVTSRSDLVELLRGQHDELRGAIARLPDLHGDARDDEFLVLRRRLAVHEVFEPLVLGVPGEAGGGASEAGETVAAAEHVDTDDDAFEAAVRRVLLAHERHSEQQEPVLDALSGPLTEAERAMSETAIALWLGDGEAYLGREYRDMVATARSLLEEAATPGHGPRP